MTTRFELYKEAIADLEVLAALLDQLHSKMKDAGVDDVESDGYRRSKIRNVATDAERILKNLKTAPCDECRELLCSHGTSICDWMRKEAK